jgi:hypothetical protein
MRIFRFLGLFLASTSLFALLSCAPSAPTGNSSTSSSPASSPASSSASSGPSAATPAHSTAHGKPLININTAILSELDKLEAKLGVPALSNKIQASRPYGKIDELVSKNVVTAEQFEQIKAMVTIEDIVLTGVAKDIDYMTKLGLMKGHLLVAKELLDLGKPDQAEPHIGHPVEEIYADVEEQLQERQVPEFKTTLIALQSLVKAGAKDATKVTSEFKMSVQAVDGAIAGLPDSQRQSPPFVLAVINGLLDTANAEYGAAIDNGKIAQAIEYQDSRGFLIYAETLYQGIADSVQKSDPTVHTTIVQTLAELRQVWPAPIPPAAAIKTPEQVSQLVKTIEQSSKQVD